MIRRFARPYAEALLKVAGGTEPAIVVRDQLRALAQAMDEVPGIGKMAANPAVPLGEKRRILREIGAKLGLEALAQRFILLLLDKYRLQHLGAVLEFLDLEIDRRLGVARAAVTTAQPLDGADADRLRAVLGKAFDRKVEVALAVDETLIAGFTARVGSTLYDASLHGQLDRLAQKLAEA